MELDRQGAVVGGLVGELFAPFALTITVALAASLLVSLTVIPVLEYWFLKPPKQVGALEREAILAKALDKEERSRYPAEEFQRAAGGPCRVEVVANCDHFYNGREDHVAGIVAAWLAETLRLGSKSRKKSRRR